MHRPPTLTVQLRRSRCALAFVIASHLATALLLATMPLSWQLRFAMSMVVALMAWRAVQRIAGRASVSSMQLDVDRRLKIVGRNGREMNGEVQPQTYVAEWVTTVVWRPAGARFSRSVLILPDSLSRDDYRCLRVLLRYSQPSRDAIDGGDDHVTGSS